MQAQQQVEDHLLFWQRCFYNMELEFLPVEHDELPVRKVYTIDGAIYTVEIMYNDVHDFYTFAIIEDEEAIFVGKLVYCENVFDAYVEGIPDSKLIPLIVDDVQQEYLSVEKITSDNFDDVRICII